MLILGLLCCFGGFVAVCALLAPDGSARAIRGRLDEVVDEPLRKTSLAKLLDLIAPINQLLHFGKGQEKRSVMLAAGHVPLSTIEFLTLKELVIVAGLGLYVLSVGIKGIAPIWAVGVAVISFVLPDVWVRMRIRSRQQAVARDLPEMVDLLNLCVSAGADFMGALNRVVREFRRGPLTEELGIILQEVRMGKRRKDALRAFARRVEIPDVASFVRTLVQADRMGVGIGEALRIQSEDSRLRRFHQAERFAAKAPLKMLIPLVLIMASVVIIVGAPVLLQFMRGQLLPRL